MSYFDLIIRKEHGFLRNNYLSEDLQKSSNIENLQSFLFGFSKMFENYNLYGK